VKFGLHVAPNKQFTSFRMQICPNWLGGPGAATPAVGSTNRSCHPTNPKGHLTPASTKLHSDVRQLRATNQQVERGSYEVSELAKVHNMAAETHDWAGSSRQP
jgi:hypothetical protein